MTLQEFVSVEPCEWVEQPVEVAAAWSFVRPRVDTIMRDWGGGRGFGRILPFHLPNDSGDDQAAAETGEPSIEASVSEQYLKNLEVARLLAEWDKEGSDEELAYWEEFEAELSAARRGL